MQLCSYCYYQALYLQSSTNVIHVYCTFHGMAIILSTTDRPPVYGLVYANRPVVYSKIYDFTRLFTACLSNRTPTKPQRIYFR